MLAVGSDGKIAVRANVASTGLLIDVQGYFKPGDSTQTGGFSTINSYRLADTRSGLGTPAAQVANGSKIVLQAAGVGDIPANATAVYASITITNQAGAGFVVPFADGTPKPNADSLNFDATDSQPLASMVPLGSNGAFDIQVSYGGPVDIVVDIEGYSAGAVASGTSVFNPMTARIYDSRVAPNITLAANSVTQVTVAGVEGIPTVDNGTQAVALNVTTANTTGTTGGFLRAWPSWADEPSTSTINYNTTNLARSALLLIAPGTDGTINIRNHSTGPVNVVLDGEGWFLGVKTGIDPTAPIPPDAPTPSPDSPATVTGPAVVSGKFTNGAGQPLSGISVSLAAADGAPENGTAYDPPVVGSTTTASDGSWSYTLPDPLPANLKALSDATNGVLNLTATATGVTSDGTTMLATDNVMAGVANGPATTQQSADVRANATPDTMAMHPLLNNDVTAPSDAAAANSAASKQLADPDSTADMTLPTWQTNDGSTGGAYDPDLMGGIDYSNVHPLDNPCYTHSKVLKSAIYYTAVDETHAYWNASSWDVYGSSMSSSVAAASSFNGTNWNLGGSITQGGSVGSTIVTHAVPSYTAKQFDVPLYYQYKKYWYTCLYGGTFGTHYQIEAHGFRIPPGGVTYKWGHSVAYKDGVANYYNSPTNRRAVLPNDSSYAAESGRSTTFSIAATAFGVGVTASTSLNSSHAEWVHAGNYTNAKHDIWGANDVLWRHPGMIYSY